MSDRFKYAKNGIYEVPYFLERIGREDSIMNPIGRLALNEWSLSLRAEETNNGNFIRLYLINQALLESKEKMGVRVFFNIHTSNENLKNAFKSEKVYVMDHYELLIDVEIDLLYLMNPENGLLKDGSLFMEYGVHVDSKCVENLWHFNFDDKVFDRSVNQERQLTTTNETLHFACYQQLMNLHAPIVKDNFCFKKSQKPIKVRFMETTLQIIHGVHMKLPKNDLVEVCAVAHFVQSQTVLHYCEIQLIENFKKWEPSPIFKDETRLAIEFGFRRYLGHLLRGKKFEIKEVLEGVEIEKMSGEIMKTMIRIFLHGHD